MKNLAHIKLVLSISLLLLLTGCKEDLVLLDEENAVEGSMTLEIDATFPSPAQASINGKSFLGIWSVKRVYDETLARKYRLLGSEAYARYITGNATTQTYQGQATLKNQDGTEMHCEFRYRKGNAKAGKCSIDGITYTLDKVSS